jgi:hypothetical protein
MVLEVDLAVIFYNGPIVTADGVKINDSHQRESVADAILKAEGYRI